MSYASVAGHRTMVFDQVRNAAFARALQACVTPDSVVLDLGAGLGILGLLAAAAGAKRVYLVEKEPVVRLARELARANGVEDRVVILEGRIEDLELPEPVDIILSVFTGNLLYSEDLLPALFHARDHWLKPGGRLLPDKAELWLAPASAEALHREQLVRWSEPMLGLDMSAARRYAGNEIIWLPRGRWQGTLLAAAPLCQLDLASAGSADCAGSARPQVLEPGLCHGLLGWIRLQVGDTWLSTAPDSPDMHWNNAFLPFDVPLALAAGETLELSLRRPQAGDWSWSLAAHGELRRQSAFLARLDGPAELRRLAATFQPVSDVHGRAVASALQWMDGSRSSAEMAAELHREWPQLFADETAALELVRQLVRTYATQPPA